MQYADSKALPFRRAHVRLSYILPPWSCFPAFRPRPQPSHLHHKKDILQNHFKLSGKKPTKFNLAPICLIHPQTLPCSPLRLVRQPVWYLHRVHFHLIFRRWDRIRPLPWTPSWPLTFQARHSDPGGPLQPAHGRFPGAASSSWWITAASKD